MLSDPDNLEADVSVDPTSIAQSEQRLGPYPYGLFLFSERE
jgi:hypothetical protein